MQKQSLNISKFSKVNEKLDPTLLTPEELVSLENLTLDNSLGKPTLRGGFKQLQLVDSVAGNINSLIDLVDNDNVNYVFSSIGTKLRKAIWGSAWEDVKSISEGKIRGINYGGNFLFTNGLDNPFYIRNESIGGQTVFTLNTLESPITGIVLTETGGGSLNGSYRYILVYATIDDQNGNPSNAIGYASGGESDYPLISSYFTLTGIPIPTDTRTTSKKLFRTKGNVLDKYYLVTILDNTVTSFIDNIADADLDTTETIQYMNTPNNAKYILGQSDIIFLANLNKTYTNRVIPPAHVNTDPAHILSAFNSGNVLPGQYSYGVSYVDADGNESALTLLILTTNPLIVTSSSSIDLWNFPEPILSYLGTTTLDTTIKKVRFYRTRSIPTITGDTIYYFVGEITPSNTTAFTDNTPDSALVYPFPHTIGNKKKSTDNIDLHSSIIFSNLYKYLEYPETNYIEVNPDKGDEITGIVNDDNGIVIFKSASICKLYTKGSPENWEQVVLCENIGCDQPDSIYKSGSTYFFVFRNRPYLFTGQGEPKPIGLLFTKTFDSVTEYLGTTYYTKNEWYVLSVKIGSAYYLLCYDMKLETWYKFTVNQADCIIRKEFGTDAGKLLLGGGSQFITTYDETQDYDTDLDGTRKDILVLLQTKTFIFPDNFVIARLRFLYLDYTRLLGTALGTLNIEMIELESGDTLNYISDIESANQLLKVVTDSMTGTLKLARKLSFIISGSALKQFNGLRLDYFNVKRGF